MKLKAGQKVYLPNCKDAITLEEDVVVSFTGDDNNQTLVGMLIASGADAFERHIGQVPGQWDRVTGKEIPPEDPTPNAEELAKWVPGKKPAEEIHVEVPEGISTDEEVHVEVPDGIDITETVEQPPAEIVDTSGSVKMTEKLKSEE